MTRGELKSQLIELKFDSWHDDEFNRDVFTNKTTEIIVGERSFSLSLHVFIDYHTVKVVWWYEKNKKVTKCYYMLRDIGAVSSFRDVLAKFAEDCSMLYMIDLNKYAKTKI